MLRGDGRYPSPHPTNVGLLDVRSRAWRFTMLVGANVTDGFSVELEKWPALVTLAVEWPYDLLAYTGEGPVFDIGDNRTPLLLTDIGVRHYSRAAPIVEVSTDTWTAEYQVSLTAKGLQVAALGADPVVSTERTPYTLSGWLNRTGFRFPLERDSVIESTGTLYQPDETQPPYDVGRLTVIDWKAAGVDDRRESQGADRDRLAA